MILAPPRLPRPSRPQRTFRTPPVPGIKSPGRRIRREIHDERFAFVVAEQRVDAPHGLGRLDDVTSSADGTHLRLRISRSGKPDQQVADVSIGTGLLCALSLRTAKR